MNKQSGIYLSLALIAFVCSFFFCNSKADSQKTFHSSTPTTTRVLGCYVDFKAKDVFFGIVMVITKDTFMFKATDSVTQKKQWVVDTVLGTMQRPIDTTLAPSYMAVAKESVSFERNVDTAISVLKRWIRNHPQYFQSPPVITIPAKKDSTAIKNK